MTVEPSDDWPEGDKNPPSSVLAARTAFRAFVARNATAQSAYLKYVAYLREHEGLSYRVEYNLACYWTRRAKDSAASTPAGDVTTPANKALAALRNGLERGELTTWARRDPSLDWWRTGPLDWRKKFDDLLANAPTPGAEAGDLTGADPVGAWAETLASIGVRTAKSLELRTRSVEARELLHEELGNRASAELIARWADYSSFFPLDGVDVAHANLLTRSGVASRAALVNRVAGELRARMLEMNTANKLVENVASEAQVEQWILRAPVKPPTKP